MKPSLRHPSTLDYYFALLSNIYTNTGKCYLLFKIKIKNKYKLNTYMTHRTYTNIYLYLLAYRICTKQNSLLSSQYWPV